MVDVVVDAAVDVVVDVMVGALVGDEVAGESVAALLLERVESAAELTELTEV